MKENRINYKEINYVYRVESEGSKARRNRKVKKCKPYKAIMTKAGGQLVRLLKKGGGTKVRTKPERGSKPVKNCNEERITYAGSNKQLKAREKECKAGISATCSKTRRQEERKVYIYKELLDLRSVKFSTTNYAMKAASLSSSSSSANSNSEEETKTIKGSASSSTQKEGEVSSEETASPMKGEKEKAANSNKLPTAFVENREHQLKIRAKGCRIGELVSSKETGKIPKGSRNLAARLSDSSEDDDWITEKNNRPASCKARANKARENVLDLNSSFDDIETKFLAQDIVNGTKAPQPQPQGGGG